MSVLSGAVAPPSDDDNATIGIELITISIIINIIIMFTPCTYYGAALVRENVLISFFLIIFYTT